MIGFEESITLYNRKYDESKGVAIYRKTVVEGVSVHRKLAYAAMSGGGITERRLVQVRIGRKSKSGKVFVPPSAYKDPETEYTAAAGDYVFLGVLEGEIPIKELLKDQERMFKILDVHDNRRRPLPHIYVEGG